MRTMLTTFGVLASIMVFLCSGCSLLNCSEYTNYNIEASGYSHQPGGLKYSRIVIGGPEAPLTDLPDIGVECAPGEITHIREIDYAFAKRHALRVSHDKLRLREWAEYPAPERIEIAPGWWLFFIDQIPHQLTINRIWRDTGKPCAPIHDMSGEGRIYEMPLSESEVIELFGSEDSIKRYLRT